MTERVGIKAMDIIISIGLGIVTIYVTHSFLIVDACLDLGGVIDEESAACLDSD